MSATSQIGKRGRVTIPSDFRDRYGLQEGATVVLEAGDGGILVRPVTWPEPESYTPERKAEFLLNNAVSEEDYQWAVEEVRKMGLDPATILHDPVSR